MNIAIIPARGGSKRIPRKNIKLFMGKPMIAWSIEAAIDSGCFGRVIVSTDDAEIAEIAESCGADVPFVRPADLSDDYATTVAVIAHAVSWLGCQGTIVDKVCCIYATAPFVMGSDIRTGCDMLEFNDIDYTFSATSYAYPVQRAICLNDDGRVEMLYPEFEETRSQDLVEAYHDAGQFYWGDAAVWLAEKPIFSPRSMPVLIPRYRTQDIDTLEDWRQAEYLFKTVSQVTH